MCVIIEQEQIFDNCEDEMPLARSHGEMSPTARGKEAKTSQAPRKRYYTRNRDPECHGCGEVFSQEPHIKPASTQSGDGTYTRHHQPAQALPGRRS
jgi:hypothetical protein